MSAPGPPSALDAAFLRYEVQVWAYGLSWWTKDPLAEEVLARDPGLVELLARRALAGEQIETRDVHFTGSSGWRPARDRLHDELVDALLGTTRSSPSEPVAVFLLGLPGSGKSSILRRIAEGYLRAQGDGTAIVRDADEVRVRVPEYGRGDGSQVVQKEVVDVTYGRATAALPRGSHLLIDVVGDPSRLPREVEHFANSGRAIVALCSQVPIEVAVERAKARALSSGRYVSIEYLRSCAGRPQAALHSALATSLVRHWALVDTAGAPTVLDGDGHFGAIGESVRYWP